ncbi:MAG TPA: amino acid ABC transporter permease [Candidatus Avimonoglobus intestinipullorum]|uniref:Amino acid ABC transporter permease n=1 Tax=Candidatus Avimonoglobus intestinipullorum TaxID=2840699 RepID=A0A9D1LWB8_9FIRM|nr:amino acid ABC transporter permease [Candidatus Avimonoglobus intestinipullorum]
MEWWDTFLYEFNRTFIVDDRWKMFASGLGNTLTIWFFAVLLGLAIGTLIAFMKLSRFKPFQWISNVYIDIIRGTPTMVQILIIYNIIFMSVNISRMLVAVIAFGINSGAYVAEIIRGGILSVNKGQMEAGRSLGLNHAQTMFHIIMPQAVKNILPALGNEAIVLAKETSVIGYIANVDLTAAALKVQSRTYSFVMPLIAIAVIYYVVIKIMTILLNLLEKRLRKADNR